MRKQGFTLVELSITLVIISLIVAAITSGAHLMESARLNKIIAEITKYAGATERFEDQYYALPGDMPNATSFWNTANGNGNNKIIGTGSYPNMTTEPLRAWQQLGQSKMVNESYAGIAGSNTFYREYNVPKSIVNEAYYFLYHFSNASDPGTLESYAIYSTTGNALQLGSGWYSTNNWDTPWESALPPADVHIIDKKIDDGIPYTGDIYAVRGQELMSTANRCVTTDYTGASPAYVLTDNTTSCRLIYWLDND